MSLMFVSFFFLAVYEGKKFMYYLDIDATIKNVGGKKEKRKEGEKKKKRVEEQEVLENKWALFDFWFASFVSLSK